jgi:hypothetical protein
MLFLTMFEQHKNRKRSIYSTMPGAESDISIMRVSLLYIYHLISFPCAFSSRVIGHCMLIISYVTAVIFLNSMHRCMGKCSAVSCRWDSSLALGQADAPNLYSKIICFPPQIAGLVFISIQGTPILCTCLIIVFLYIYIYI